MESKDNQSAVTTATGKVDYKYKQPAPSYSVANEKKDNTNNIISDTKIQSSQNNTR